jgi:hypothetical protein
MQPLLKTKQADIGYIGPLLKRPLARSAALTFGPSSSPFSNLVICSAKTYKNIDTSKILFQSFFMLPYKSK